jgi:hypothetical protein
MKMKMKSSGSRSHAYCSLKGLALEVVGLETVGAVTGVVFGRCGCTSVVPDPSSNAVREHD